jgi:hypothetical protein
MNFYTSQYFHPNFFWRKFGKGNPIYRSAKTLFPFSDKSFQPIQNQQKQSSERRLEEPIIAPSNRGANVKGFSA